MIEIRLCKTEEIEILQEFIHQHWRANHVLAKNKELLLWQHYNKEDDCLNFVVAHNSDTNKFQAILGFIPLWNFDSNLKFSNDLWLSLWKSNESDINTPPGLGLQLLEYLEDTYMPMSIGVTGINEDVTAIYEWLGYETGYLNHYYYLNPRNKEYNIAVVKENFLPLEQKGSHQLIKIILTGTESVSPAFDNPQKSIAYLINRYQNHPFYHYLFYGLFDTGSLKTIFVIRKNEANGHTCLRITDIYGSVSLAETPKPNFSELLISEGAEYIDCLNFGATELFFQNSGFKKVEDAHVIIPNYFEPFEQKNVRIKFAFKSQRHSNYVFYKGDSDQDRPNIL